MTTLLNIQPRTGGQSGFTLIELIISITLMAFILTVLGAGLRTVSNGWNKYTSRMSKQDMLLRAFSLIRRDIAGLQRITWSTNKKLEFIFRGETSSLQFVAIEPPYPSLPGPYILSYLAKGEAKGTLSRSRAKFHPEIGSLADAQFKSEVPLIEGPYRYRFSYAEEVSGNDGASRSLQWFPAWPYSDKIPDLIRLEVQDARSGKTRISPLMMRPRVDAEQACVAEKTQGCTLKLTRNDTKTRTSQEPEGTGKP